jgi:hypothetical protein
MAETKEEKKIWVKMPNKSGVWKAEKKGDEITGKYLKKLPAPFMNRPNFKYCLESDHPLNVGGKVLIYGTTGLNNAMEDVPIGYKVRILYQGDSKKSDPTKQPFQKYDVYALMDKEDPLYQKILTETGDITQAPQGNSNGGMRTKSYPEARVMIDHYLEVLKDKFKPLNCESVLKKAEADTDLESEDLTKIKLELIEMHKAGEIKRAQPFKKC